MASKVKKLDPHKLAKLVYFADKEHMLDYGRPITGDRYMAMEYGPVPSFIYDLVKDSARVWTPHLQAFDERITRHCEGERVRYIAPKTPFKQPRALTGSDCRYLEAAAEEYGGKNFDELTAISHRERAWAVANAQGKSAPMDIRLMVDDDFPNRTAFLRELQEAALC